MAPLSSKPPRSHFDHTGTHDRQQPRKQLAVEAIRLRQQFPQAIALFSNLSDHAGR